MSIFVFLQIYEMNLQKNFTLKLKSRKIKQKKHISLADEFQIQLFEQASNGDMPKELKAVLMSNYDAYQIFESFKKKTTPY